MSKIVVNHTSIVINNYELGDKEYLEKKQSIWNKSYYRYDPVGYVYNESTKQLLLPRGVDINFLERTFNTQADFNYAADPSDTMSIRLKLMPRDDVQRKSISFLIGEGDFSYTKKYSQLLLNLDTGIGKTYVATAALTFYRTKAIIITHIDKIKKQWYDTFMNITDIDKASICDITGSYVINALLDSPNPKFKIYLINHATINAYATKHGWESVGELFRHLKIGVKIYDEAHLCFENMLRVDMYTNTKRTLYLTATFNRSDPDENRLFEQCTKSIVRYGSEARSEKRKHIVYLAAFYNSYPDIGEEGSMSTIRGWSKIRYADYLMGCKRFFEALTYMVNYFINKEGKMLILSSKIETAHTIAEMVKKLHPDKVVSEYHSKISSEDREKAFSADIISSTPQSAGTGADIRGLRCVINTESYSSKVSAEQMSGRLREYSPTANTFYVELVDRGFRKVQNMYRDRLSVFKKKCVKVCTINLEEVLPENDKRRNLRGF